MTNDRLPELVLKNARFCNVFNETLEQGDLAIDGGCFCGIGSYRGQREIDCSGKIVAPAFIDGHIHLESSMASPAEFARMAASHGTAAAICDPHELANVCGTAGIDYLLESSEKLPVDCFFMLPSCVPAAAGEENGAALSAAALRPYYKHPRVLGLGEVMDLPGILNGDKALLEKLQDAKNAGKRIDGHAPGLCGKNLDTYLAAGITTDHECSCVEEAREKLRRGMWILLREGTAARNLNALLPLLTEPGADRCLFATDDKHPDELLSEGHIDLSVRRAIANGVAPLRAIRTASRNAAECYGLHRYGAIAPGYFANFIITDDLSRLPIESVWHNGKQVFPANEPLASTPESVSQRVTDTFHCKPFTEADFSDYPALPCQAIGLIPGEILTKKCVAAPDNSVRLAVAERHKNTGHIGKAYLCGYGLRRGAVASSIAHDSHNLIVAGANARDMAAAAEAVRRAGGGLAAAVDGRVLSLLELPIGGLMSRLPAEKLCEQLEALRRAAETLGDFSGIDPFMTLAFVSLPVIPEIRLTSRGIVSLC